MGSKLRQISRLNTGFVLAMFSWEIDGETVETVSDFIFWGSKITADGDYSHEKTLTPWKESYDQPRQHIRKQTAYSKAETLLCQQRFI